MPAWWGRKSSKSKEEQEKAVQHKNPYSNRNSNNFVNKSSISNDNKKKEKDERPRSFDEQVTRASPRASREFTSVVGVSSSGFLGFDSDGGERAAHPLPRPSVSSLQGLALGNDQVNGLGSGSASVSSVSSSGSDDPLVAHCGAASSYRCIGDPKVSMMPKSPGPRSRGPTSPTSPLHPRLCPMGLESPTGKQEDGKSVYHPLPLPPGSPTSPFALASSRTSPVTENTACALSKWKKGKLLGRGTFGHVYVGFNSESGQMCAIKEVRLVTDDQSLKECLKQLNQEINLLSQLSHPNIVRYHGSELGEDALSVYLEYVSGGSIYKLLQEYGAFNEPVIQNYTRQIVSGLAYLHERNTVHRDIKGANILVGPNGEIKLADFGMAKHITNCASMLSFKGSPYWMAPEVVMNTNGYSLAVDIWSLGCTILEMATSKPPWSQYEEYINFLQEKVNLYEGSYQGWSPEPTKLVPWKNHNRSGENLADQSQVMNNGSGNENNVVVSPAMLPNTQNSLDHIAGLATQLVPNVQQQCILDSIGSGVPTQPLQESIIDVRNMASRPQFPSLAGITSSTVSDGKLNKQDEHSGSGSISSAYSQGVLNNLTQALQSAGLDLSLASISVQMDVANRASSGLTSVASSSKARVNRSMNNQMMTQAQVSTCDGGFEPAHKRFRTRDG